MRIIDKTKQFLNIEKAKIRIGLLKLVLAVPFWIVIASLILIGFGVGRAIYLSDSRPEQKVAQMWQSKSETSYRHMVVFAGGNRAKGETSPMTYTGGGKSIHLGDLSLMRQKLQAAADTGSGAGGKNISGSSNKLRGWEDCYSSTVRSSVSCLEVVEGKQTEVNKADDVELVAVGGNYRAFHPFRYLSGGFLPEVPVDTYQVVINDVLAWKFYRSYDVVGHMIEINGKMFTIIGVVEEKNTKVAELAGEQENRVFIYFGALGALYGGDSSQIPESSMNGDYGDYGDFSDIGGSSAPANDSDKDYAIQCYEAMLPELVKGVAVSDFKNGLPSYSLTNPQVLVVNDTDRFKLTRVLDTMFPLGETDKERLGYEFPYWEIATQMTETRLFYDYVITAFGILLFLIGIVMLALKFRAKKTVTPAELVLLDVEELPEEDLPKAKELPSAKEESETKALPAAKEQSETRELPAGEDKPALEEGDKILKLKG